MLCYPVISSGAFCHPGSFERLLGKRKDFIAKYGEDTDYERARRWFSLETQVHASTPRTFVWQTVEDDVVRTDSGKPSQFAALKNFKFE